MWRHHFAADTDLPPEALWPILADVAAWPTIDANIARLTLAGPPAAGTAFTLQPRGGPSLRFTIARFEPPTTYADVCHLPGATMTTTHRLRPHGRGARIEVEITVAGWLRALWVPLAARKHAAGLPQQTDRFIAAARARYTATATATASISATTAPSA